MNTNIKEIIMKKATTKGICLTFTKRLDERIKNRIRYIYHLDSHIEENGNFSPCKEYTDINLSEETRRALMTNIENALKTDDLEKLSKTSGELGEIFLKTELLTDLKEIQGYLMIESNDEFMPWHLLRCPDEDPFSFLGLIRPFTFIPKTRRLGMRSIKKESLKAALIADPTGDIGLVNIEEEISAIRKILEKNHIFVEILPNVSRARVLLEDFREILRTGEYDIIHFAGHGDYERGIAWLNLFGGSHFDSSAMESIGTLPNSPILFFNVCFGGRADDFVFPDAYRAVNTFAPLTYKNRARAFIGAFTAVRDDAARDFAVEFYKAFIDEKKPLGLSAQQARRQVFSKYQNTTWTPYVCYGHPTLLFLEKPVLGRKRNLLYGSEVYVIKEVCDAINNGLNWLLLNQEMWIRDVHQMAEVMNILDRINPLIVSEIPNHHLHWFKMRLEDLFEAWINNRRLSYTDIGICGECEAGASCNYICYSYVSSILSHDMKKRIVRHLLRKAHDHQWYFAEEPGFDKVTAATSGLVVDLLVRERRVFEEVTDLDFDEYISKCVGKIISLQNSDGSWKPPRVKGLSESEKSFSDDPVIETEAALDGVRAASRILGESKLISKSFKQATQYFTAKKNEESGTYWWNCKAHYEDRKISRFSDVRATTYAVKSLLLCNLDPYSKIVTAGVRWLLKNYDEKTLGWPLDTRFSRDDARMSSTRHATNALYLWVTAIKAKRT